MLTERYGVAKMTTRNALNVLVNEGLVFSRRGAGTFVRDFAPIRRIGIKRLARAEWAAGRSIWKTDVRDRPMTLDAVEVYEADAPTRIGRALGLEGSGRVWVRSRRYLVDGKPVQLATSYLPADLVGGSAITQADPGPGGIYARLADLGHAPQRFTEELRARMPMPEEAEQLGLGTGTPVITICRTAFAEGGRTVEVNEMILDAGSYVLQYDFNAS